MGSVNSGKPIVLNGGSKYTRDLNGLAAALTGVKGSAKGPSRLGRLTGLLRRGGKRKGD
jgi:hypothetical protein